MHMITAEDPNKAGGVVNITKIFKLVPKAD